MRPDVSMMEIHAARPFSQNASTQRCCHACALPALHATATRSGRGEAAAGVIEPLFFRKPDHPSVAGNHFRQGPVTGCLNGRTSLIATGEVLSILQVRGIEELSIDAWSLIDRRGAPTFQARPAWALALADANAAYAPAPLACTFEDGSKCIVPLVRSRGPLGWRIYLGTPLGGYTVALRESGEIADPARAAAALRAILERGGHSVTLTPWPLMEIAGATLAGVPTTHETSIVDLSDGAEAAIARMDGKSRRMAGQASRRGVDCARANDAGAVDRYYAMLQESAVRWGRKAPTFPKRLLEALAARGGEDVEIWFATFEGEAIAGGVMLYGSNEANFWSAAMRSEFGTLRPSNALNVALMKAAAQRGIRWYNLGSSEGLPGVARFKEGLGAVTVSYVTWKREAALYSFYRSLRPRRGRTNEAGE